MLEKQKQIYIYIYIFVITWHLVCSLEHHLIPWYELLARRYLLCFRDQLAVRRDRATHLRLLAALETRKPAFTEFAGCPHPTLHLFNLFHGRFWSFLMSVRLHHAHSSCCCTLSHHHFHKYHAALRRVRHTASSPHPQLIQPLLIWQQRQIATALKNKFKGC